MIARVDGALMRRVEELCHAIEFRTGWTNFDLVRAGEVACVLMAGSVALVTPAAFWFVAAALGAFFCAACFIFWPVYRQMEEHYAQEPGVAHPYTLLFRAASHERAQAALYASGFSVCAVSAWAGVGPSMLGFVCAMLVRLGVLYCRCAIPATPRAHREYQRGRTLRLRASVPAT